MVYNYKRTKQSASNTKCIERASFCFCPHRCMMHLRCSAPFQSNFLESKFCFLPFSRFQGIVHKCNCVQATLGNIQLVGFITNAFANNFLLILRLNEGNYRGGACVTSLRLIFVKRSVQKGILTGAAFNYERNTKKVDTSGCRIP